MKKFFFSLLFLMRLSEARPNTIEELRIDSILNAHFLNLIDKIDQLNFIEKAVPFQKTDQLSIEKDYTFKYNKNRIIHYSYQTQNDKVASVQGGITVAYYKKRISLVFLGAGVRNLSSGECDTSWFKVLLAKGFTKEKTDFCCNPFCFFNLRLLNSNESAFLKLIVGDSLYERILEDYCNLSILGEIISSKFSFTGETPVLKHFDEPGPVVFTMKELFYGNKYNAMQKLLATRSKIFNWFVAEALYFYDSQAHFLSKSMRRKVLKYNSRGHFPEFRNINTLKDLYFEKHKNPGY